MISEPPYVLDQRLADLYQGIEDRLEVADATGMYGDLVRPNGNAFLPIHRWFHFKEAFSARLLPQLVVDMGLADQRGLTLFDPFCGVGTSLLSAMQLPSVFGRAVGIEVNPFVRFVAETKTGCLDTPPSRFVSAANDVVELAMRVDPDPIPGLSTFSNPAYFSERSLTGLLRLKAAIALIKADGAVRDLLTLALAGAIEPSSSLRRDGRALRHEPGKTTADPSIEFQRRARWIAADLLPTAPTARVQIIAGDARHAGELLPADVSADLTVFSPPYPNNIDYTEVYKLEAWLLGFISTEEEFRAARRATLQSHPSILYSPSNGSAPQLDIADHLVAPLLEVIPDDRYAPGRRQVVRGYFRDMAQALAGLVERMPSDGRLVYVVGNSLHGSNGTTLLVAADLLIAALAEELGYEVESFVIARRPARRAVYPWLRESVVVLRPPSRGPHRG